MTAYEMRISDGSSDVCSSDLRQPGGAADPVRETTVAAHRGPRLAGLDDQEAGFGRCVHGLDYPRWRGPRRRGRSPRPLAWPAFSCDRRRCDDRPSRYPYRSSTPTRTRRTLSWVARTNTPTDPA